MLGSTFYHQTIRKYVAVFGTLFNDINIQRRNSAGVITEQIKVPIEYSAKDKMLLHIRKMSTTDASVMTTLPRMGFVLNAIAYDGTRKLNTLGQVYAANTAASTSTLMKQYNPVPYNFDFALTAMVDNSEDGAQIFEQIVPFFTPEFTVTINPTTLGQTKMDIPLILNNVDHVEDWEGDFDTRRSLTWTLGFTARSYMYGRITTAERIKRVMSTLFDGGVPSGTTQAAGSMIDIGVTGPSGASSDISNYTPTETLRIWGSNAGDIDIYGDIIC